MATRKLTTSVVRVVYTSPCGRVKVERHDVRDYLALFDDQPIRFFENAFQADTAGHAALTDALAREAEVSPVVIAAPISLPLRLGIQIGAAFERQKGPLGITQNQVYKLIIAGEIIDREMPPPDVC